MAAPASNHITPRELRIEELETLLVELGEALHAEAVARAREYRISTLAFRMLRCLARDRFADTYESLSRRLASDAGSISTAASTLVEAGLASRSRFRCCSRMLVEATEIGIALVNAERAKAHLAAATHGFSDDELQRLIETLSSIAPAFRE